MTVKFDSGFDPITGDIDAHYTLVYSRILQTNSILAGWMTEFRKLQEVERNTGWKMPPEVKALETEEDRQNTIDTRRQSRESRRVEDNDSCDGCLL